MAGQIVGYIRVSSVEQNPARQIASIGEVEETFTDRVSGGSRAERVELAKLLRHVRRGDTVKVASMDRLARSVVDLAQIVAELTGRGVRVEFLAERLTFGPGSEDPFATFQLHLLGAVAQLERSLIRERQREGIEIAKAKGVYRGRARRLTAEQVAAATELAATGVPKAKIARDLGCSRRVLYDALAGNGAYATTTATTPMTTEEPGEGDGSDVVNPDPPPVKVVPPAPVSVSASASAPVSAPVEPAGPPATPAAAEPPRPKAAPRATGGKATSPRVARWFLVELGDDDSPNEPVVVLAERRSEQAARNEATRWRRRESARHPSGTGATYEVRHANEITYRLELDTETRRSVVRKGPPPVKRTAASR